MVANSPAYVAHFRHFSSVFRSSAGTGHLIPFLSDAKFLLDLDISGNVTKFSFNSSDGPEVKEKDGSI